MILMMMMRNATHSHARLFAPRCVFFYIWIRHLAGQKIFFKHSHTENKIEVEEEEDFEKKTQILFHFVQNF
jgi:hypothetical protein